MFAAGVACAQGREPDWMISATAARAGRKRGVTPIPRRRHCVPRRHATESGQLAGKPALLFVYLAVRDGSEGRNRFVQYGFAALFFLGYAATLVGLVGR